MATERIMEHIDQLRQKPEHVRHRIALGIAGGITALVTFGWGIALLTSDTLAVASPQPETPTVATAPDESTLQFSNLMGAAGAALTGSSTAELRIVDSKTSSTMSENDGAALNNTSKTVIPF